jgi:hypothetical protein
MLQLCKVEMKAFGKDAGWDIWRHDVLHYYQSVHTTVKGNYDRMGKSTWLGFLSCAKLHCEEYKKAGMAFKIIL